MWCACGVAGRRDDLWSWLYIVVEMLEGTLPWRTSSGDASANSEHSPKETAQRLKQEALENPQILSTSGKLSGALLAQPCVFRLHAYAIETLFHWAPASEEKRIMCMSRKALASALTQIGLFCHSVQCVLRVQSPWSPSQLICAQHSSRPSQTTICCESASQACPARLLFLSRNHRQLRTAMSHRRTCHLSILPAACGPPQHPPQPHRQCLSMEQRIQQCMPCRRWQTAAMRSCRPRPTCTCQSGRTISTGTGMARRPSTVPLCSTPRSITCMGMPVTPLRRRPRLRSHYQRHCRGRHHRAPRRMAARNSSSRE